MNRAWPDKKEGMITLKGHTDTISCIIQMTDGRLVSASWDGSINMWDLTLTESRLTVIARKGPTGSERKFLETAGPMVMELHDHRLLSYYKPDGFHIRDLNNPKETQHLITLKDIENFRTFSQLLDDRLIIGFDNVLKIWDITKPQDQQCITITLNDNISLRGMAVMNDGRFVTAENIMGLSEDIMQRIILWDLSEGGVDHPILTSTTFPVYFNKLHDGRFSYISSNSELVIQDFQPPAPWTQCLETFTQSADSHCLATLTHESAVKQLIKLNGKRVISVEGYTAKLWDITQQNNPQHLKNFELFLADIFRFTPLEGDQFARIKFKAIEIWNLSQTEGSQPAKIFAIDTPYPYMTTWLGDLRFTVLNDDGVKIWDFSQPNEKNPNVTLPAPTKNTRMLQPLNDGRLVTASRHNTLNVWELSKPTDRRQVISLSGGDEDEICSLIQLDDHRLASIGHGSHGKLRIWHLDRTDSTGNSIDVITESVGTFSSLIKLTDQQLVSGHTDGSLRIWDLTRPVGEQCISTVKAHIKSVASLVRLDNGQLVTAGDDILKVWDFSQPDKEQCVITLYGHDKSINQVIQLDAEHLVSGSDDKTVKIWKLPEAEPEPLHHLIPSSSSVTSLSGEASIKITQQERASGYLSPSLIETYHQRLLSVLSKHRLQLRETAADNLCFFNAIAMQLGITTTTLQIRLINQLLHHQQQVEAQFPAFAGEQFNNLIMELQHGEWGDAGMARLISWVFSRRVILLYFNSQSGQLAVQIYNNNGSGSDIIPSFENTGIPADLNEQDIMLTHNGLGHWLATTSSDLDTDLTPHNSALLNPQEDQNHPLFHLPETNQVYDKNQIALLIAWLMTFSQVPFESKF